MWGDIPIFVPTLNVYMTLLHRAWVLLDFAWLSQNESKMTVTRPSHTLAPKYLTYLVMKEWSHVIERLKESDTLTDGEGGSSPLLSLWA